MAMSDKDLLRAIRIEVDRASQMQDERRENREEATEYFYGRSPPAPAGDDAEGMSGVVSTDVADAVEAVLAEILPAFSGQSPVEFVPLGPDDESQADQETRAVTHVAMAHGAYMALNMAVKDALLRRAGVLKVSWETRADVAYERLDSVALDMLPQALQEQAGQAVEIVDGDLNPDLTASGTIRRYTKRSVPRIDAVPLDEFLIDGNVSLPSADEARFLAHRRPVSRSDLIRLGFDPELVASLAKYSSSMDESTTARARSQSDTDFETGHTSTEFILACECYYQIDSDGDGIAELRRIVTAGGTDGVDELLLDEPWDEQPFCVGVPYLGLYSWDGISLYDKLKAVQDTKTDLLRGLIDATKRNLRQRIGAVERLVNMDDLLTSAMGGVVRIKDPTAIVPIPDVQVPPQLLNTLTYMDDIRRDKGGGAIDTAAQAQAIAGDTAHGLERMMSAAEQVNAMVAKNLAETMVKPMYRKLHKLMRTYFEGQVQMRAAGQWQSANPAQWSPRDELVISMGMSVGERTRRTAALQMILAAQGGALQAGQDGVLVGLPQIYATQIDLARMTGLPAPEQYWINPAAPEAQKAAQGKAQQAQQQAQQANQLAMAQVQVPLQMQQIKAQSDLQRQQMQGELDALKAHLSHIADMLEQRIKLVELNAKYDAEQVPDTIAAMRPDAPERPQ
jgi:hypothetical protein